MISFICLCLFVSCCVQAQNIDSLKQLSKTTKVDSVKCTSLIALGDYYMQVNPDSSTVLFNQVILLSKKNIQEDIPIKLKKRFQYFYAYSTYCLGYYDLIRSKSDLAKIKFEKALKIYQEVNNQEGVGDCLNNIGYIYYNKGDISTTLDYYRKAAKIYLKINYLEGLVASYTNIAAIYGDQEDFQKAVENYEKAIKIAQKIKNDSYKVAAMINIGLIYLDHADTWCKGGDHGCINSYQSKALRLFQESYQMNEKLRDKFTNASVLTNLGILFSKKGEEAKARRYFEQAETVAISANNYRTLTYAKFYLADLFFKQKEKKKAQTYAEESLLLAKKIRYPEVIKNASNVLRKIYISQKKFEKALEMTTLYHTMKDSITKELTKKSNIKKQLEIGYEKRAFADSLRAEKEKAIVRIQLEKKENQQKYLIIILIISILSAGIIYNRFIINKKQKLEIEQKHKELARLNTLNQKIFSIISHDFKGPITTLKSLLAKEELISNENQLIATYLKDIGAQLNQSDEILESLLDWAKDELSITFSTKKSMVLPVLNSVLTQMHAQLKSKDLKVVHHIDETAYYDLPEDVLKIVLRNLISNAIKYSFEGKTIHIELSSNLLKVVDEGKGIEAKKLELLFSKQVASGLGTNHETGFGLGLYMCNELLHKHHVSLKAFNNVNQQGCTFVLEKVPVKTT